MHELFPWNSLTFLNKLVKISSNYTKLLQNFDKHPFHNIPSLFYNSFTFPVKDRLVFEVLLILKSLSNLNYFYGFFKSDNSRTHVIDDVFY